MSETERMVSGLGRAIFKLRTEREWSLAELHEYSGVARTSLHLLESGKQDRLNKGGLQKLADAFGLTFDEFQAIIDGKAPPDTLPIFVRPDVARTFYKYAEMFGVSHGRLMEYMLAQVQIVERENPQQLREDVTGFVSGGGVAGSDVTPSTGAPAAPAPTKKPAKRSHPRRPNHST